MSSADPNIIEAISTVCFFKEIKQYICQAVSGIYMAPYRFHKKFVEEFINQNQCKIMVAIYLNNCWHSYWKKTDNYVVNVIDKALSWNIIKGQTCLFNWFMKIILLITEDMSNFVSNMDTHEFTIDAVREKLYNKIEEYYDKQTKQLMENISIKCTGECDNTYDEKQDLFVLKPRLVETTTNNIN